MKFYVFVFAVLATVQCALAQAPASDQVAATDARYRIGYQDTLDIQVFRHPELNRRSQVNPDGTINLFRLEQPIMAVCKTENELAADIAKAYEKDYLRNPEVSVTAVERKSQTVYVVGAVNKPGSFYIDKKIQLLQLLAYAQGPDLEHVGTRLVVFRPGSTSTCRADTSSSQIDSTQLFTFKLKNIEEGKTLFWMEPGDVVSVADADQVYVYGNVNKQGAIKMKESLTLTQAIASAEGLKPATETDNIRVIRQKEGTNERTELVFNFKDISKGKAQDPVLEPNDIVAVSQDKAQSIINSIGKSLTNGIPSILYRVP